MPGRRSNVSATPNEQDEPVEAGPSNTKGSKEPKEGMSVDDFTLPKSMIGRLAKGVLPPNTQIHKDALLALHKSATVFVSYLASNANDITRADGKKVIPPMHVMTAIKDAELEHFLPRLEAELQKYNEVQCDKRNNYRRRVKQEAKATESKTATPGTGENGNGVNGDSASKDVNGAAEAAGGTNGHADEGRPFKKFKGQDGAAVARETDGEGEDDDDDVDEPTNVDEQDEDEDEESGDDVVSGPEEEGGAEDDDDAEDRMDETEGRGQQRDEALDYDSD